MLVRIGNRQLNVRDEACAHRSCLTLGEAKRPTSCATRATNGCPKLSVCTSCFSDHPDPPGTACPKCRGLTVARVPADWHGRRLEAHREAMRKNPDHACEGVIRGDLVGAQPEPCALCDPLGWALWDSDPYVSRPELKHGP